MTTTDTPSPAKVKRFRGYLPFLVFVAVCILACVGIYAFFNLPYSPFAGAFSNGCIAYQPERIENFGHFSLPPSAKNLESFCAGLQGWIATAKFEMSPSDAKALIASTLITSPLSSTVEKSSFDPFITRLIGNSVVTSYLYGSIQIKESWQAVLIDTSDPSKYVVYIAYGTG